VLWAALMGVGLLPLAHPAALAQSAATPSGQFDWSKVPPVTPMPRLGVFLVSPSGPGYYSLWDLLTGSYRSAPPLDPYAPFGLFPPSFFDVDFRYLEKPDNPYQDIFDPLKRIHLGNNVLLSFGGSFRIRHLDESKSRLTAQDNAYDLVQTRLYGDLWYRDNLRLFVEFLDAHSFHEELPPLAIDVNRFDLLNLFIDAKVVTVQGAPVYLRVGRQELLYGSQRLITTLDWANTRRTFQGVKVFWHGAQLDLDAFWTRPVVVDPSHFDSWDTDRDFTGIWATYRPMKGHFVDLYFLSLNDDRKIASGRGGVLGTSDTYSVGARYAGDYQHILWELEGVYQFGHSSNQDLYAGAVAAGVGYHFAALPMNPQLRVRYDYASGDGNPGHGSTHSTFNQLFPFGHYYLGWLDRVGRQNIQDFNLQLAAYPMAWLTAIFQYHHFWLANKKDALYNAAGQPSRRDPTGQAGKDVGDEIDLRFNVPVSRHQDIFFGYSKLFAGEYIARSFPVTPRGLGAQQGPDVSPDFFYLQYGFRF